MGASKVALAKASCPVARAVDVIGDRWSLLIIRDVFDGICRFGALQRSLGLARNILTERLRTLVAQGVLETRPASDGTAYHEYAVTEKGADLFPILVALRQWGEGHLFTEGRSTPSCSTPTVGSPSAGCNRSTPRVGRLLTAPHTFARCRKKLRG